MAFWRNKEHENGTVIGTGTVADAPVEGNSPSLLVLGDADLGASPLRVGGGRSAPDDDSQPTQVAMQIALVTDPNQLVPRIKSAPAVLALFRDRSTLDTALSIVVAERNRRGDGLPVLVIAVRPEQLAELGSWLYDGAVADRLHGIRLIVAMDAADALAQLPSRLGPVHEPNVIKMPASTEVECKDWKYFYTITPDLRYVVRTMKELAENGVSRIYLLGGPGAGKTSLAYYYYLCRNRGNFVSVNLNSESTGNKEAMKSLLCGHVTGSIAGGGSREGALSFAADGVAFLDESHGVTGVVMQVLMEVLDSGQFLPFGATKKRALECAVIFASNRSWEALRNMMQLDEHARLGATIIALTDLAVREEDLIAVLATTLAKFKRQCTTWSSPVGVTPKAWEAYRRCPWRGNTRTLIRVTETAFVNLCLHSRADKQLIDESHVQAGITLWEPEQHESHSVYTSFTSPTV